MKLAIALPLAHVLPQWPNAHHHLRGGPAIMEQSREGVMIGAPWVEGQNLEGADLAPFAMREAGLREAGLLEAAGSRGRVTASL